MKRVWLILAGATALGILGWVSSFLYWHFKITRALRIIEVRGLAEGYTRVDYINSLTFLRDRAGCRALPYLVNSLDAGRDPEYLARTSYLFVKLAAIVKPDGLFSEEESPSSALVIQEYDSPEIRAQKCASIRAYWKAHGDRHHQVWRVWTRTCAPRGFSG